jgi:hypothetical protein
MTRTIVKRLALASISLAVTGCGSQGSSPGVPATLQQTQKSSTATSGPTIYVTNPATKYPGGGSILGFSADANGNVSPTVNIQGPKTGLGYGSASVVIDKLGRLYTAGSGDSLGFVYIWAAGSNGDVGPTASLQVGGDVSGYPMVLTFDRAGNLWVASSDEGGGWINEYAPIPADATGDLTSRLRPLRTIDGPRPFGINNIISIALNRAGRVSIAAQFAHGVLTFGHEGTGNFPPLLKLLGDKTKLDGNGGISYDSQGRLVACTNRHHQPRILTFAAGAQGNVAPLSTLKVTGCKGVTLDSADNVYVAFGSSITEYAAGATGPAAPLRVISGNLTGLTNASGIAF